MNTKTFWRLAVIPALLAGSQLSRGGELTLAWLTWRDSEFQPASLDIGVAVERDEYRIQYDWLTDGTKRRFAYVHQPLLIRAGEPAHNGYFHRLDYQVGGQYKKLTVNLQFGLHGSSNMFNHAKFHDDSLVATFQLEYPFGDSNTGIGLNGDYRFGHFQVYPTFQLQHAITDSVHFNAALPYRMFLRQDQQNWRLGMERYGNKWGALDRDREVESAFYLEEWRVIGEYRVARDFYGSDVFMRLGMSFDTTVRYLDLLAGDIEAEMDNAAFIGLVFSF